MIRENQWRKKSPLIGWAGSSATLLFYFFLFLLLLLITTCSAVDRNRRHGSSTTSSRLLADAGATTSTNPADEYGSTISSSSTNNSVAATACKSMLHPTACESALALAASTPSSLKKKKKLIFDVSLESAIAKAHSARSLAYNLTFSAAGERRTYPPSGASDCLELLDSTLSLLADVLGGDDGKRRPTTQQDTETWLSAALTNQMTCLESLLQNSPSEAKAGESPLQADSESLAHFISNSLALHKAINPPPPPPPPSGPGWMPAAGAGGRKLLATETEDDDFPSWVSAADRRLLSAPAREIVADAVVAVDGSGTHGSITEALGALSSAAAAKKKGARSDGDGAGGERKVIYVKAGTYKENIRILKKQEKVMLVGEGKGKSVIVGSRNADDGWTTYQSATVAAQGAGFIARDLSIINDSGASKHQAVALRVGADHAVVHRCSIEGYQDTLYAHSNRQFYRDCDVYGTVDFVFGNAAAVFQNCRLSPRRPSPGQKNSVTAQGRSDPNQNTGFSIQGCRVAAAGDLGGTPTFLGRPWHKFSRVVVMQSYLDHAVHPAGWEPWSGAFALQTLYYGEYENTGPGAAVGGRVRWPGVHPKMRSEEATQFTVGQFISGNAWLPSTGVDFTAGL